MLQRDNKIEKSLTFSGIEYILSGIENTFWSWVLFLTINNHIAVSTVRNYRIADSNIFLVSFEMITWQASEIIMPRLEHKSAGSGSLAVDDDCVTGFLKIQLVDGM